MPCISECFFCFGGVFLASSSWLEPLVQWSIEMVRKDILFFFLILKRNLSVFQQVWYRCEFAVDALRLRKFPSIPTLLCFYFEKMLNFVKWFFCLRWKCSFCPLLIKCITLIDFWMLNQPYISGINPSWSWCVIFSVCCWIRQASILLRTFVPLFIRDNSL